jgi:hypothetical protein
MSDTDPITRLNAALEGRYRIESELGEGGMATVYLADDLKHERKVALKVLKPELAAVVGAERFLAEIKTTANLQHPHILPLFDSGEADTYLFYVMPYVEGETLRDRLDREHQLPVDDAVRIASDMAEALDYAHRQGVIHRDIKPANTLLQAGKPVISDFGIALAVGVAGGGRMTETGLSLGTPHYMSPEQATGDMSVGAATDVYALGCVLYETLVGEPPFTGSTPQAVLGKIVTGDAPSAGAERRSVPPNVDAAIRKALEKLPADRFGTARDFSRAVGDPAFRHGRESVAVAGIGVDRWKRLAVGFAVTAVVFSSAFGWALLRVQPGPSARFELTLGRSSLAAVTGVRFDLSADGTVVYVGPGVDGGTQLWRRLPDDLEPDPIPGTEGGRSPAMSPDGLSVAFEAAGGIWGVSLSGGEPFPVTPEGEAPTWGSDRMIYFARDRTIHRVPEAGGEPVAVTASTVSEQKLPDALPDGRGILVSLRSGPADRSRIGVVGPEGGEVREILTGTMARYAVSGHIVYVTVDGMLMAAPFDLNRLDTTGSAVGLEQGVEYSVGLSEAQFALSETGTLLYRTGSSLLGQSELVWVTRSGEVEPVDPGFTGSFGDVVLSPQDQRRATLTVSETGSTANVWVKQLDRGPSQKATFETDLASRPTWTPDGASVTYRSGGNLWTKRADGSDAEAVLQLDLDRDLAEGLWSHDGEWLIYRTDSAAPGTGDILAIRLGQDTVPVPLAASEAAEATPAISRNGRWLAYSSDESGRRQVYVKPFPSADARFPVSTSGGSEPAWSHSGSELFYRSSQGMVAVQVETESEEFSVGESTILFPLSGYESNYAGHRQYDVEPGDNRFIMIRLIPDPEGTEEGDKLILVQNWFAELGQRLPN